MKTYKIAAVPIDGFGHEIVIARIDVLKAVGQKHCFKMVFDPFP